ncbi:hypothetical protein BY996DRAFT_6419747 [Phakopsora pachyrhizi]|nr:hypothetical protein BY996DRAFT_6419747 [Phakopsora pachyrhizi]
MPPDIGELKNEVLNTTVRIPSTPLADLKWGVQNNVLPEVFSQLGHNSLIFSPHCRVGIQAIDTSLKNTEVSKRLGQIWNKLPAKDKLHYLELAKSHKDEFQKKFPDYVYRRKLNNTEFKQLIVKTVLFPLAQPLTVMPLARTGSYRSSVTTLFTKTSIVKATN